MTIWCTNTFPVDEVELAWGEAGSGPPLVLVHGYTGSAHDFALHFDSLGDRSHVFALDHRGHGHSTNTGDPSSYSVTRLVDDLEAWAEGVVGEPFDLLGHSMGGRIALMLTQRRPDLVKSLILMDTTAWAMVAEGSDAAEQLRGLTDEQLAGYIVANWDDPESVRVRETVPQSWIDDNHVNKVGVDVAAARAYGLSFRPRRAARRRSACGRC
ncbi:MAG: putative hydrolase or acyltransferase of alpha/beta superfamily [Ilumatobacteraceae bacterium]|nr:putative hydrolase or acyltransferase of alpha/beta superfamily [Ilumatobacteraceae bacterium]MCU1388572.1 putative hydrolase or acyltransferase of alpha/beta superfamily [Ilumatobacteraceae bacterium]